MNADWQCDFILFSLLDRRFFVRFTHFENPERVVKKLFLLLLIEM